MSPTYLYKSGLLESAAIAIKNRGSGEEISKLAVKVSQLDTELTNERYAREAEAKEREKCQEKLEKMQVQLDALADRLEQRRKGM